jgi:GNAT superfamily N-acetyltransferase
LYNATPRVFEQGGQHIAARARGGQPNPSKKRKVLPLRPQTLPAQSAIAIINHSNGFRKRRHNPARHRRRSVPLLQPTSAQNRRRRSSSQRKQPTNPALRPPDIPTILELIRELAEYEHALSDVQATPALLSQTIAFAGQPTSATRPARCLLLITPQQTVAGLALYFYNYSTWRAAPGIYLEDLFVRETERRKGYAGLLLAQLAKEVVEMKGGRLEWSVLKWNRPSIEFYEGEAVGAAMMDEWVGMRVDGEALVRLAGRAGKGKGEA